MQHFNYSIFSQQDGRPARTGTVRAAAALLLLLALLPGPAGAAAADLTPIHDVQGSGGASPLVSTNVTVRGIVTGVKYNGFFLQAPEAEYDADPATSEGLLVYLGGTPPDTVQVGSLLQVAGKVAEYRSSSDLYGPTMTELGEVTAISVVSTGQALPAPVALTAAELSPTGELDQLEPFEGMRVGVARLTVVAPTQGSVKEADANATSNGIFFGVLEGTARPFREPGVEKPDPAPNPPCCVPVCDGNPERLKVDSDGLAGTTPVDVATGATAVGLVGPLDFASRNWTLLPEAGWTARAGAADRRRAAAPVLEPDQASLATANLQRFFDTVNAEGVGDTVVTAAALERRLAKLSRLVRERLGCPDILCVQEVENLATLQLVADRLNADALAAGSPDPGYQARLEEGNDPGGIDTGFLARSNVTITAVTQHGKDLIFTNPVSGSKSALHDRPPLVLEATLRTADGATLSLAIVGLHLRSNSGLTDPDDAIWVRAKRQAQAEDVAALVQGLQTVAPDRPVLVAGDFNAFEFSDGYADVTGTIAGRPAGADQVAVNVCTDLVNPDLDELFLLVPEAQRYSYTYNGNAQVLDHLLASPAFRPHFRSVSGVRVNADCPEVWRNDAARPERLSDHDPVLLVFSTAGLRGDLNGDLAVDALDLALLANLLAGQSVTVTGETDLDGDGRTTAADLALLAVMATAVGR